MKKPSSRADRRRQIRGTKPPRSRDGMRSIYIGFGMLLLAVFGIFGAMRWNQQRRVAQAYATPSPGPNASAAPIQLIDGQALGSPGLPARTVASASGAPIDGIRCDSGMTTTGEFLHIHSHLALFAHGRQMQIPAQIGMVLTAADGCLYWIHTHDASGIIHVESPHVAAPQAGAYTLAVLFRIWGERISRHRVGPYVGLVTAFVNGSRYRGPLGSIALTAHQQITLEVGLPTIVPPNYAFPPND